jgi:polysaccharide biosynthesis PFTS motif protein
LNYFKTKIDKTPAGALSLNYFEAISLVIDSVDTRVDGGECLSSVIRSLDKERLRLVWKKAFLDETLKLFETLYNLSRVADSKAVLFLTLARRHKVPFEYLHELASSSTNKTLREILRFRIKYSGFSSIQKYKEILYLFLHLFLCCIFPALNLKSKKTCKLAILAWRSSLPLGLEKRQETLDQVKPDSLASSEVLVFSRDSLSGSTISDIKTLGYCYRRVSATSSFFQGGELSRSAAVFALRRALENRYNFLTMSDFHLRCMNRVCYHYLFWLRFVERHRPLVIVGYNDYTLSDTIRNLVADKNGSFSMSYHHSVNFYSLYNNKLRVLDHHYAFTWVALRYVQMPEHARILSTSKAMQNKTKIIGPLYTRRPIKNSLLGNENFKVAVVCTSTHGLLDEAFHIRFLTDIFSLIRICPSQVSFIIKGKDRYQKLLLSELHKRKIIDYEPTTSKRYIIEDSSVSASEIIRSSRFVICMPFSSCWLEAMGSQVPAVFFDPLKKFGNNYYTCLPGVYATTVNDLVRWLRCVNDGNFPLSECLSSIRSRLKLKSVTGGVLDIRRDISMATKLDVSTGSEAMVRNKCSSRPPARNRTRWSSS